MKVSVIFGTRPEAIKLAPVILALQAQPEIQCRICVTAQHRQMLDSIMAVFGLVPDTDMDVMQPGQSLASLTSRVVSKLDRYMEDERPDLVLVQGDTTTVFCAALVAFYHHVPVGHVEAGLRTGNLQAPWPEEANRVLTSRLARLHFAPTESARQNLLRERVADETIHVTGNTVIDALHIALGKIRNQPPEIPGLPGKLQPSNTAGSDAPRVVLITGHRRENFGPGFEHICRAIAGLAQRFPDVHFVYPVHLNPNVREPVKRILGATEVPRSTPGADVAVGASNGDTILRSQMTNIHLLEPLSYLPFVALMNRATLILTDSGGVQEEAPSLGKPVLVMRDTTERPEGLAAGLVRLVGTDCDTIMKHVSLLLNDQAACQRLAKVSNPYGNGRAAEQIVAVCRSFLIKDKPDAIDAGRHE